MAQPGPAWAGKLGPLESPCISVHTGPVKLDKEPIYSGALQQGCTATPLIDEHGTTYFAEGLHPKGDGLHALRADMQTRFFIPVESISGGPALLDGALIAATEKGVLVCFDMVNGNHKWIQQVCGACSQDPWSISANRGTIVMAGIATTPMEWTMLPPSDTVYAVDADTGNTKWTFKPAVMLMNFTASITGDFVVFTDLFGGVYCLHLADGSVKWQVKGEGSMIARASGGACVVDGVVYQTLNLKAKKAFNAPAGGKGSVRALDLKTGDRRWEHLCEQECHAVPCVAPNGPGGKPVVVVGVGASCGSPPPAPPAGDEWPGKVLALSTEDGSIQWTASPAEPWKGPTCSGCTSVTPWKASAWTTAACGADGTVYIGWHGGDLFAISSSSGEVLGLAHIGAALQGTPAIGPGFVAVASIQVCIIISVLEIERPRPEAQVLRPLERPYSESGTEHFWSSRLHRTGAPYLCDYEGPSDLSKPAWCYRFPDREPGNWALGGPVIDAQRGVISGLQQHACRLSPDGMVQATLKGPGFSCVFNVLLDGPHMFLFDLTGCILKCDLGTMELVWRLKVFTAGGASGLAPSMHEGVLLCGGRGCYSTDGEDEVCALESSDGSIRWRYRWKQFTSAYNTFPQVHDGQVILGTASGGLIILSLADGTPVWEYHPPYMSMSTGGPTLGPGGIFVTSNLPIPPPGSNQGVRGSLRAFDLEPKQKRWELEFELPCTQVPIVVPKELVDGTGDDIVVFGIGHQVCSEAHDKAMFDASGPFRGKLFGLDSQTGKERWSFKPPPLNSPYSAGSSDHDKCPPDAWSGATIDARGTIYVYWQSGHMFAISGKTGQELSRYFIGTVTNGQPALAPGMLVVTAFDRIICWRDPAVEERWLRASAGDPRAVGLPPLRAEGAAEELGPAPVAPGARQWEAAPRPAEAPAEAAGGEGCIWVVVGGSKGGIVVRRGEGLKTAELPRLSTGSRIKEIERKGDRLHYEKVSGDGPDFGWVSLSFKGSPLVKPE